MLNFQTGDKVHAFSQGVLRKGIYVGVFIWSGFNEPHSLVLLDGGEGMFLCRTLLLRHTKEIPPLAYKGAIDEHNS